MGHETEVYRKRFEAFGCHAVTVDGHNIADIINAFDTARDTVRKPFAIIAKTFKGKYFPEMEDKDDWHGKPLGDKAEGVINHLKTLIKNEESKIEPTKPDDATWPEFQFKPFAAGKLEYKIGEKFATRKAYGTALKRLGIFLKYCGFRKYFCIFSIKAN